MARIVFMGTPAFAVPVLDALTQTLPEIAGVFTRPDQPAGRGRKLQASPVKELAETRGLPVFQPKTLRRPEGIAPLRDLAPDLAIVAAYGLILPAEALAIPRLGCVNTHASLLPRHRGAAPVAAAILTGDPETGVTLMQMDTGLDTGPILAQRAIPIAADDTAGTLTMKLSHLAADFLVEMLPRLLAGDIIPTPQDESRATVFKTMRKEEGLIDWARPALEIERRVRAFNPWPSAYTFWQANQLKILRARAAPLHTEALPGRVLESAEGTGVMAGDGVLLLREVQLAGKRAMSIEEFMRGQRGFLGAKLESAPAGN